MQSQLTKWQYYTSVTVKFKKQNVKKIVHPKKEKKIISKSKYSKVEYLKSYIMIVFYIKTKQINIYVWKDMMSK